ncbi:MAG: NAD(P)-dependent oxidoreductase [Dysgonomonas sp.]
MRKILLGYKFLPQGFVDLEKDFELIYPEQEYFRLEEILRKITDCEVFVPSFKYQTDKDVIDAAKNLKLIANFGVGYNNIDVDYAAKKGIVVTNTPNSVLEPTAELCFSLMLSVARRIPFYDKHIRVPKELKWGLYDNPGVGLYGKTLGIYGMGRIGQAVARRAVASGMKIIYHNRKPLSEEIEKKYSAKYVSFEELLTQSDVISLNAPATPETYHLMGEKEFDKMKKTAILINTSRGILVDEPALAKALSSGTILAAGLDVFEHEPKITEELLTLENVVLTPHAGTQTIDGRLGMQKEVAENIIGFYNNGTISKVN